MILDKALDIIAKGKMGSILVMKDNKLHYKATKGYVSNEIERVTYDIEDIFYIYQDRMYNTENLFNPIILKDLEKNLFALHDTYNSWNKIIIESPYELLACGICIDGRTVGFIDIFNTSKENSFDEEDKKLLKYLCYDIAIAFKNAELLENIIYMSRYDNLTAIYNRHYFEKLLNKTLKKAKVSKESFVICALDLNNFKEINDIYGHDVGDKVLMQFVKTFKTEICENDFLNFNEHTKKISFAYGLSQFQEDSIDVYELLKIADKRMYEQKRRMKELKNY